MQHNIYFLISWQKKTYNCLLTRGAKPISFYCNHDNLFRYIFTHSVIPFPIFCARYHVSIRTKGQSCLIRAVFKLKLVFDGLITRKRVTQLSLSIQLKNNNASTCQIFNNMLKYGTYMNTITKNICLQFSVFLGCTKAK